ncbi:hypothetical protein B0H16DRAFT_1904105 [Mycena metata]|uniref:Uncharacterized protein n=1 Tax=Mycena metata TaxID=1033252 RepID=A0AAD7DP89_9AGAR|nr:hypothetical protein B0H16DRAFT_1904105 [Mycena metata]
MRNVGWTTVEDSTSSSPATGCYWSRVDESYAPEAVLPNRPRVPARSCCTLLPIASSSLPSPSPSPPPPLCPPPPSSSDRPPEPSADVPRTVRMRVLHLRRVPAHVEAAQQLCVAGADTPALPYRERGRRRADHGSYAGPQRARTPSFPRAISTPSLPPSRPESSLHVPRPMSLADRMGDSEKLDG